jgi:SAM-dependent methyltransferase
MDEVEAAGVNDEPVDVPSPIDLKSITDAEVWADSAMAKRPYREQFFRAFVQQLGPLCSVPSSVLELGAGPGFLAQRLLEAYPLVEYTALDLSPAMHALARARLGPLRARVRFMEADFKGPGWSAPLPRYQAVVTMQAVHELRHKRHAPRLYQAVRELLIPGGVFLICDHVCGEGGTQDKALYMTLDEHKSALHEGGFVSVSEVRREGSLVLYRAEGTG